MYDVRTSSRKSVMAFGVVGDTGSPSRQDSTQGSRQTRGRPPPTTCAKSRSGFGSRPGASAISTRPCSWTETFPAAQSVAASCAARSPRALVRATRITGGSTVVRSSVCGQAWPLARDPSSGCSSVDSPAPPCAPTHQSATGGPAASTLRRGRARAGADTADAWGPTAGSTGVTRVTDGERGSSSPRSGSRSGL